MKLRRWDVVFVRVELCPRARLITVDDDFRRDRRYRQQAIPLEIPDRA